MLVLARRIHERILIGDDILVEVIEVRPGVVRIGITAPDEVKIWRTELLDDENSLVKRILSS